MAIRRYKQGAELKPIPFEWQNPAGGVYDFSSGWTFLVRVGTPTQPAVITKTAGLVGAATSPNLTINWAVGELDVLTPGTWTVDVFVTETATGKNDTDSVLILIEAVVQPAA